MDELTLEELQVLVRSLEKTYMESDEIKKPAELLVASNLYEKAKQAYSDALYASKDLPWK